MERIFKIYIINLKHKTSLKKEMIEKLSKLSIDYEFFEAIYGRDLDEKYYLENEIKMDPLFRNSYMNSCITTGEIGCSLSHYFVWKRAFEEGIKYPIVLEDDANLGSNFEKVCLDIIKNKPDFDMVYLGRKTFGDDHGTYMELDNSYNLMNPTFSYWTVGYMLSLNGVKKLVNSGFLQNLITVDEFLPMLYLNTYSLYCNKSRYNIDKFNVYAIHPSVVSPKPNTFLSSETEAQPFYNLKYENNFYNNVLQAVTVGTDPVDGYQRYVESTGVYGIPYVCLGFGKPWCGNDMAKGAGGGHKVVLLKQYLEKFDDNDDRLLIFTDCYDVVFCVSPDKIIDKFNEMKSRDKFDILISSEAHIWPDKSLEPQFPDVGTPYKFLNSGGFMGSIKDIKKMIQPHIESYDDDQYYYQIQYLKSVKKETELVIKLDAKAEIFQTLSSHFYYIDIDFGRSSIKNSLTNSEPLVIHGNGGPKSKMFFDKLCNYLNLRYRHVYGYKDYHSKLDMLTNIEENNYPTIYANIIVDKKEYLNNITNLFQQNYPKNKVVYHVLNITDENLETEINDLQKQHNVFIYLTNSTKDSSTLRTYYISLLSNLGNFYDYFFMGHIRHVIQEMNWFKKAITSKLDVVAPMLKGNSNKSLSNFWGEIDSNSGFYARSWDYMNLINNHYKGYWNVPYISGSLLINKNKRDYIIKAISNEHIKSHEEQNFDMFFCRCLQLRGIFMFITNYENYGYITE